MAFSYTIYQGDLPFPTVPLFKKNVIQQEFSLIFAIPSLLQATRAHLIVFFFNLTESSYRNVLLYPCVINNSRKKIKTYLQTNSSTHFHLISIKYIHFNNQKLKNL